jgi:SAM-dependent methyltransferase
MKCRICGNADKNRELNLKENQHGTNESFTYFQCAHCECIQIAEIPENLGQYYPNDYYAFDPADGNSYLRKKLGFFKSVQTDYLIYGRNPVLGSLFTIGYPSHRIFDWLRNMQLSKNACILDIGCGAGVILKQLFQLGFHNLTGVDPFIEKDYHFSDGFHIYKKDPLELEVNKTFDCIMMHHSFEHMVEEKAVLRKAKDLIKPGGKILIRIPIFSKPLLEKYGEHLVSLDAPRHIYVHSPKSMELICRQTGLKIDKIEYDADAFSFWASEQYSKGILLPDENSYDVSKERSMFSKTEIQKFKKEIRQLNKEGKSDAAAFYISTVN